MDHRVGIELISKDKGFTALLLCSLYLVLHWLQVHALGPEWIRFHGKDLLLVPMLLLATEITGKLIGKPVHLGLREVLLCLLYVGVAFELLLPKWGLAAPGDWRDVLAYSLGAWAYQLRYAH